MKLFFAHIEDQNIQIPEDEQHHMLKVLRLQHGSPIAVTNGKGLWAEGSMAVLGKKVSLQDYKIHQAPSPKQHLHIAIAPTKNIDRIEFFVEKATEMGIAEISFILSDKSERKDIKLEKLQKQAIAASKQSLRFHFPKLNPLQKLSDFIQQQKPEATFICHCDTAFEREDLKNIKLQNATFLVGPEGDFSLKEIQMIQAMGIKAISLGQQRLRTETAALFLSAWAYGK